jgi:hypothetical protein
MRRSSFLPGLLEVGARNREDRGEAFRLETAGPIARALFPGLSLVFVAILQQSRVPREWALLLLVPVAYFLAVAVFGSFPLKRELLAPVGFLGVGLFGFAANRWRRRRWR